MPEQTPWWVAGIMSAIGVGYALYRLYDFIRGKNRDAAQKDKQIVTDEQREERRNSATEAWQVVDRLTREVEGHAEEIRTLRREHGEKISEIEQRERVCEEERIDEAREHTAVRTILRMLVAWARKQKNPPPIPDDVMQQITDGSKLHPPTSGGTNVNG